MSETFYNLYVVLEPPDDTETQCGAQQGGHD
jgi:hypothetical protein